uniref:Bifunctional inhibitor/plant lipid transfer protein/seed storage helical domain-containing protein n=1 Tax=Hordeum vulgare subsp. vulgare TaxID=112509 RepID=A0A8I6WST4_HORVV
MAPTRSLVLLVAYTVLAAVMLQPSEERVQTAKAPSAPHLAGGKQAEAVVATSSPASPFTGVPQLPPLPGLPPLAGLPALPPSPGFPGMAGTQPSPSPSQQPAITSCLGPLILVAPCARYLTNSSVRAPPRTCCDGLRSLVGGGNRICLCHAIMGDLGTFAGGTIDQLRMLVLPLTCSTFVPPDLLLMCIVNPVPPILPE